MRHRIQIVVLSVLACLIVAGAIVECGPVGQGRVTATPTKTPRPTFTATALPPTATETPLPSPTPLPTDTPTPSPIPSDTPLPTETVTQAPPPTAPPPPTVRPPATATRGPAPKPTATRTPKPTNTPAPPFVGAIVKGYARCDGYTAVTGFVKHANGTPYPNVAVGVWSDLWDGEVHLSEASGKFDVVLNGLPIGKFNVAVVKLETCGGDTARNCQVQSNVLVVTVTQKCEGTGANQVTEVKFTGP